MTLFKFDFDYVFTPGSCVKSAYQTVIVNRMCFAQIVETKRTHKVKPDFILLKKFIDSKIRRIIVTG